MNGVEILSQNNIYETEVYWWIIALFAGIGLLIGLVVVIINWVKDGFDSLFIFVIIVFIIGSSIIGSVVCAVNEHETDIIDYVEYKVMVSEDVNFVEFMNKYEVLEQEGKIYTIRERE